MNEDSELGPSGKLYSKYTLDELRGIESYIDRESFPIRYKSVLKAIKDKQSKLSNTLDEERLSDLESLKHYQTLDGPIVARFSMNPLQFLKKRVLNLIVLFVLGYLFLSFVKGHDLKGEPELAAYCVLAALCLDLIPMILIYFDYRRRNEGDVLRLDFIADRISYTSKRGSEILFSLSDIEKCVTHIIPANRKGSWAPFAWDEYKYRVITLLSGRTIIVTSLLLDLDFPLPAERQSYRNRLFPITYRV